MKKYLILTLGVLLSILFTCDKSEDEPDPTCYDGIQNGNETGVDCGGDCMPCFECITNYCSLLSGALSSEEKQNKRWSNIESDDYNGYNFESNGLFTEQMYDGQGKGYWKFDDPDDPSTIHIHYTSKMSSWPDDREITLLLLTADTLRIVDPTYGNNMTLIPM